MAFDFITSALDKRRSEGLLRSRHTVDSATGPLIEIAGQHYINFSSNDYLAMRRSSVVAQAWVDGISEYGGGSGASPLVTGYTNAHQALEEYLASELKRDKVLLFNSGFAANQAVCQALFRQSHEKKKDRIIADKLMHASFIEGAQASSAELTRFKHNDIEHLQMLLNAPKTTQGQNTLVATEGVFSMDGDQAPLSEIVAMSNQAKAWLMVDDAHGFGALGIHGRGVIETDNLSQQQVPILMATFGKAIGTAGAFVAGSHDFIDYLINFGKHYIYSTAMPAAQAYATLVSLQAKLSAERRTILAQRIEQFKSLANKAGLALMPSNTAIQPVLIGDAQKALAASEKLKALGLWVTAIRYPTVPKHTDRLRITLTAGHDTRDIEALVDGLQIVLLDDQQAVK
ncbi:8-amino-7-oxononanoate synthase [Paraglaciecola sp. MB-3u-78]|jgi:8-amino-7-oxononanoate synthase|uniref:aminotransferase class I/II-fold pyridoxal phosphate-dependent enzyme n=1 Tax=Paraglaciecola sp. MB-3u-78 TaxID=2058332 RepID=UPI000C33C36A|nr:8-amino-7-oxononanoate synthase [Paraglaciecola sp. MB-3u-78]PKG99182.1 8-amino-7-oxononanoate synthase [Paraglaciecola sp. MB-3u-78]